MKIIIVICIIIIALLGFGLFGIITDEIDEAKLSPLHDISKEDITVLSVDRANNITNYTHRISTYVDPSEDLVKEITLSTELDFENYFSAFYYDQSNLVVESFSKSTEKKYDLSQIQEELAIIIPQGITIKTNLNNKDLTYYKLSENENIVHIVPSQTGLYEITYDDFKVAFECIKLK